MTKPHVMRDQLAMLRFQTMRRRSNAEQAKRRSQTCGCVQCQLKQQLGDSLAEAIRLTEAALSARDDDTDSGSKTH